MKNDKFVFFYGGVFSQWYPSSFEIDDVDYCTAEQYMMAKKASYFDDFEIEAKILRTDDPSEQKSLGRQVKNFDKEAWDAVSRGFVYEANVAKFTQNPKLLKILLETNNKELVEASPYDKIWGIGLAADHPDASDKTKWRGTNWLGETLMKVREDLQHKKPINRGKAALKLKFKSSDLGREVTLKQYLTAQLKELWRETEGFSGKRPFGNSGWDWDIYVELIKSGIAEGELDEDGYILSLGNSVEILMEAIDAL